MEKRSPNPRTYPTRRPLRLARLASVCALLIFCFVGTLPAQTTDADASTDVRGEVRADAFRSSSPNRNERPTFVLSDADGAWNIPLPNWTLEEVMKTIDEREEKSNDAAFSIQSVDVVGSTEDGVARLTIQFGINVTETGAVRVPLGLQEGVYIPRPNEPEKYSGFSFEGAGFCALDVDSSTGEYVAVVHNFPDASQTFQTSESVPATQTPESTESVPATQTPESTESVPATQSPESTESVPATQTPESTESVPATQTPESTKSVPATQTPESTESVPATQSSESTESVPATQTPESTESVPATPNSAPPETSQTSEFGAFAPVARHYADENAESDERTRLRPRPYTITLELCFAIETLGVDAYRLKATFPPSVHSQMTLETPLPDVQIDVVRGALAAPPTTLSETSSELKFHGLGRGGETTEISWRKTESQSFENRVVYQVEDASIEIRLDSRETLYDATLPIRAFGGESDVFLIRLPERASLVEDSVVASGANDASFEIRDAREISTDSTGASVDSGTSSEMKTVEIRLAQKTTATTLKLSARAPVAENVPDAGTASSGPARALSGFEVVNAQKQYGQIKIVKTRDLDFNVSPIFGARAETERTVSLEEDDELYSFFSQPFLLEAQAFVRQIIVNVKPEYQTTIGENEARLRARFQYSIYGSKISEFRIRLNGWNLANFNAEGVVDVARIYRNESTGETIFPLKTPTEGVIEFDLDAARSLETTDGVFVLPTPTPTADWVEPAALVVIPTDNVELTPLPERFVDLTPKPTRALALNLELPKSQQSPTSYQTRQRFAKSETTESPTFAGRVQKLEQKIEIAARTEIVVSEQGTKQIRQTFVYQIEHEPLDEILIQTPLRLLETSSVRQAANLKILVDGKSVPPQNLQLETNDDKFARRRILLGDSPKIGACVVSIQYDGGTVEFQPEMTSKIELNLMQPEDETLVSNELTILAPLGVSLEYVENNARFWRLEETGRSADGRSTFWRYHSATREFLAAFNGVLNAKDNLGVAVVDRAWIQTWFSAGVRLDRAAYRVSSDRNRLEIRLPKGVRQDRVAVSLDRVPFVDVADPERGLFSNDGTLVVPVSEELQKREFVLELTYSLDRNASDENRLAVDFPEFVGDSVWTRRAYWQILTPFNRHIVVDPSNWTPEYVVGRSGFFDFYRRVASTTPDELCDWIGIPKREKIPTEVNSYLFSSFNPPTRSRLYAADRALLILIGSGAALAIGLGLVYFPFVRSRGVLLIFSLLMLTLAAFRPLLALLFLQTTVFGVALTLATAFVAKILGRKDGDPKKNVAKIAQTANVAERVEPRKGPNGTPVERKKRNGGSSRVASEKQRTPKEEE